MKKLFYLINKKNNEILDVYGTEAEAKGVADKHSELFVKQVSFTDEELKEIGYDKL